MKLIIDIPEEKWEVIQNKMYCNIFDLNMWNAIKNGTPIPDNATVCDIDALLKEIEQQIRVCYEMQNGDMLGSNDYKYRAQGLQKAQDIIGKHLKGGK